MMSDWQVGNEMIPKDPGAERWARIADLFEQIAGMCEELEHQLLEFKAPIGEEEVGEIIDAVKMFLEEGKGGD